jgi:hypothetical protein
MEQPKKSKSEILNKEGAQNKIVNNDKDKTFNKLKEIQDLLKKESSLVDLCKFRIYLFLKKYSLSCQRRCNKKN